MLHGSMQLYVKRGYKCGVGISLIFDSVHVFQYLPIFLMVLYIGYPPMPPPSPVLTKNEKKKPFH